MSKNVKMTNPMKVKASAESDFATDDDDDDFLD